MNPDFYRDDLNSVNAILNSLGAFDGSNVTMLIPRKRQLNDAEKYEEAVKNQRMSRTMTALYEELREIMDEVTNQ